MGVEEGDEGVEAVGSGEVTDELYVSAYHNSGEHLFGLLFLSEEGQNY